MVKQKYICYNWMSTVADHIIDLPEDFYKNAGTSRLHNVDDFNPYSVKENDLIFVKTDFIVNGQFQNLVLDKILKPFNLITGISSYHLGRDGGSSYKKILNHPLLRKWICTNPPIEENSKIIPIPIGFEEPDRPGGNQDFLSGIHENRISFDSKEDKIFLPFHGNTAQGRKELFNFIKQLPFVVFQEKRQSLEEYYFSMNKYKYVIGLEGSGPDIHRNYEAMLVGSIPINVSKTMEKVYDFHSVECIFLNDWSDLNQDLFHKILLEQQHTNRNDEFLLLKNLINTIEEML